MRVICTKLISNLITFGSGSISSGRHQAEDAVMAEEAMKLMTDEEISAGGLGTALKNAQVQLALVSTDR